MSGVMSARYSRRARVLHWLSFVLVVAAYASITLRKLFERGCEQRLLALESHFMFGIAVLLVALPRLLSRLGENAPPMDPPPPLWMLLSGWLSHGLLYAFLIVQPLLGIVARLAEGRGIGVPLSERVIPSFFGAHQRLAGLAESAHVWLGEAFYWVIGLHILAALFHLLVRRDNVVRRMT